MSTPLTILDLFCGLGGFSQAFRDRGHRVIGVDIVPPADVLADVRFLPFNGRVKPDIVLASPPCQEFTKAQCHNWMRHDYDLEKGRELVLAALAVIEQLSPRWWCLENVLGCAKYAADILGLPTVHYGSRYLWGRFPLFLLPDGNHLYRKFTAGWKRRPGVRNLKTWTEAGNEYAARLGLPKSKIGRAQARSLIPYPISEALCLACERAPEEVTNG